ncbi:ead/Ea22-like family protein [Raoultella planticola]|nr:ead/Ea22-like family protein [Raoultella planticola]
MTDITELAQSLKAAAMKATPGQWVAFTHTDSLTLSMHTPDDKRCGDVIKWAGFDGQRKAKANAEFIALANPANILALVEALEKAQAQSSKWLEAYHKAVSIGARYEERIAELESRTVKIPGWFVKDAIAVYDRDEIEEALSAAGIKVEAE